MYLHNITLIIENEAETQVIAHIRNFLSAYSKPANVQTINLLKMIDSQHEGSTYCLQLQTSNQNSVSDFQQKELQEIQAEVEKLHPGKVLYFASTMQYLD